MGNINENLSSAGIQEQKSQGNEIQVIRQNDKEKAAWKKALELFPIVRQHGEAINNPDSILQHVLANRVRRLMPIPFVGFWGIGDKANIDSLDIGMIDNLRQLRGKIKASYEGGAKVTVILADTHGVFNGFGDEEKGVIFPEHRPYLHQVQEDLKLSDITTQLLSELYFKWNMQLPNINDPRDTASETYDALMENYDQYVKSAEHNRRNVDKVQAAYHYVAMRLQERQMLIQAFPNTILFVNGGKRLADPLMPKQMPILYLREGPVWFRKETK